MAGRHGHILSPAIAKAVVSEDLQENPRWFCRRARLLRTRQCDIWKAAQSEELDDKFLGGPRSRIVMSGPASCGAGLSQRIKLCQVFLPPRQPVYPPDKVLANWA